MSWRPVFSDLAEFGIKEHQNLNLQQQPGLWFPPRPHPKAIAHPFCVTATADLDSGTWSPRLSWLHLPPLLAADDSCNSSLSSFTTSGTLLDPQEGVSQSFQRTLAGFHSTLTMDLVNNELTDNGDSPGPLN